MVFTNIWIAIFFWAPNLAKEPRSMSIDLLCCVSGLSLNCGLCKLFWQNWFALLQGKFWWLSSVWLWLRGSWRLWLSLTLGFYLSWFQREYVFCLMPLRNQVCCLKSLWYGWRESLCFYCTCSILLFRCISIYLIYSFFTYYASLYLVHYAWNYARMSRVRLSSLWLDLGR